MKALISVCMITLLLGVESFAAINVQINQIGEATQFQFDGKATWVYSFDKNKNYFELKVERLNTKAVNQLKSFKNKLINKVEVINFSAETDKVRFYSKAKKIDGFDYQMEEPSRLIVDFFIDESKKVVSKPKLKRKVASELSPKIEEKKSAEQIAKEKKEAEEKELDQIAKKLKDSDLGTFDGGDPDFQRFQLEDYEIKESAIIASRRNIYIQYPFLIKKNKILDKVMANPPIYEVKYKEADETKQVLLLKQLFEKKRYAVFLTTKKFFEEKYPGSKYSQLVRYMEADVYYALWKRDKQGVDLQKSLALYQTLIKDFPKSPLAERTKLLIAYTYYSTGDNFGALKSFIRMLNSNPDTKYKDDLRISIGDAYRDLNKYQDALDTYNVIYLDEKAGEKRVEAKYKIGDVYARKKDYKKSIRAYQEALKEFPTHAHLFPNAFYNIAESQFWLGDYRDSLDSYIKYARNYPKSSHGGFALTRIGEILEILGADEEKYKGAFLESWFRFRGSEGANIGRIRFISHHLPKMKPIAVDAAHREIESYVSQSELPFIKDFSTIVLSDGYYKRGELEKSLFLLEDFYKSNSTSTTLDLFRDRIVKTVTKQVEQKVDDGKYVDAIQVYGKHAGSWLRDADRVDLRYYLGKSFEKADVTDEAIKIYKATVNRLYAIRGTDEEKERAIFENLPKIDQLNLRIAKAYSIRGDFKNAEVYLKKVPKSSPDLKALEEIEKVLVQSNIDESKGRYSDAIRNIRNLLESWKGRPELVQEPYLRIGKLLHKSGKNKDALQELDKVLNLHVDTGLVKEKVLKDTRELSAKIHLDTGNLEKAGEIYQAMIKDYEKKYGLNDVRYKLGEIYFKQGNLKLAKDTWNPLQTKENGDTWYRLAREKMNSKEWDEQYQKYLNRLPASQQ